MGDFLGHGGGGVGFCLVFTLELYFLLEGGFVIVIEILEALVLYLNVFDLAGEVYGKRGEDEVIKL